MSIRSQQKKVVLLDLDECLGSFGVASTFFYLLNKKRRRPKYPFTYDEIKYLANNLIRHCMRPGILSFLKRLRRSKVQVILFTNHSNSYFLPFLRNCLNFLVTGKVRAIRRCNPFFKDWVTRNDPRRKTTPKKDIGEILDLVYPGVKNIETIMFDDSVHKIIGEKGRDTIVSVPEYEWDPTYEIFAKCWEHLENEKMPPLKTLLDLEEDFEDVSDRMPSHKECREFEQVTYEFFDKPFISWFCEEGVDI